MRFTMRFRMAVLGFAVVVLVFAFGVIAPNLGSEFIPRLSEGAMALGTVRLAGTSLEEVVRTNTQVEKVLLAAFPDEIKHVWSRAGTAEVATDPMGVELTDIFLSLKPRGQWTKATTQEELTVLVERELRSIPGLKFAFSQPIEMRPFSRFTAIFSRTSACSGTIKPASSVSSTIIRSSSTECAWA